MHDLQGRMHVDYARISSDTSACFAGTCRKRGDLSREATGTAGDGLHQVLEF